MKKQLQNCTQCNEETFHMVGKKQSTTRSGAYTRRTVVKCCECGKTEINNKNTGKRVIAGKNKRGDEE